MAESAGRPPQSRLCPRPSSGGAGAETKAVCSHCLTSQNTADTRPFDILTHSKTHRILGRIIQPQPSPSRSAKRAFASEISCNLWPLAAGLWPCWLVMSLHFTEIFYPPEQTSRIDWFLGSFDIAQQYNIILYIKYCKNTYFHQDCSVLCKIQENWNLLYQKAMGCRAPSGDFQLENN